MLAALQQLHTCRQPTDRCGILISKGADVGPGPRLLRAVTLNLYVTPRVASSLNVNTRCKQPVWQAGWHQSGTAHALCATQRTQQLYHVNLAASHLRHRRCTNMAATKPADAGRDGHLLRQRALQTHQVPRPFAKASHIQGGASSDRRAHHLVLHTCHFGQGQAAWEVGGSGADAQGRKEGF